MREPKKESMNNHPRTGANCKVTWIRPHRKEHRALVNRSRQDYGVPNQELELARATLLERQATNELDF